VRFHPRGRKILDNVNAKAPIMKLLSESKDQQVEAAALVTLQKVLLTNWYALLRIHPFFLFFFSCFKFYEDCFLWLLIFFYGFRFSFSASFARDLYAGLGTNAGTATNQH
jgi:hypothetical protein